jgi:hypothetical protein
MIPGVMLFIFRAVTVIGLAERMHLVAKIDAIVVTITQIIKSDFIMINLIRATYNRVVKHLYARDSNSFNDWRRWNCNSSKCRNY